MRVFVSDSPTGKSELIDSDGLRPLRILDLEQCVVADLDLTIREVEEAAPLMLHRHRSAPSKLHP